MGKCCLILFMFFLALIMHSKARTLPSDHHASNDLISEEIKDSHDTTKQTLLRATNNNAPAESPTSSTGLKDKKNFIYGGVGGFAGMGGYAGMVGGMPMLGGLGGMGKYGGLGGVGGIGGVGGLGGLGSGGTSGLGGLGGLDGGPGLGGGAPAGGAKGLGGGIFPCP